MKRLGLKTLAEINVTPLVDVMLVLLIVFMISAPLMQQGMKIDLPKANTGSISETPQQLKVSISRSKQISIEEHVVPNGDFLKKLEAIKVAKPDVEVAIQADQNLAYGFVAQVIAEIKKAGIQRVGLITHPENSPTKL